jgi:hypothetical protein
MDDTIQLYSFVRSRASIYIASIEEVTIQPDSSGRQTVALRLHVEQTLWGDVGGPILRSEFTQPGDDSARLKFPNPIWGRVNPRQGARVFLVTRELGETPADPLYVDEVIDPNDVVLSAISNILSQEKLEPELSARKARYLAYLTEGKTVKRLFGAEALAKDRDLPEIDPTGEVAVAMAAVFVSNETIYVRLSVGTWMWENIYPRTNPAGKAAVINATIKGMEDASEDGRRFSENYLASIDPADLKQPGVVAGSETMRLLQERLSLETAAEIRDHLQEMIDALNG